MFRYMIEIMVFVFGMCVGSFMNVCIFRLPDPDKSIVHPRSMCPACATPIPFYDNIPVLSYIFLRGRCRHCNIRISFRYPLIEIMGGLFSLCVFLRFGLSVESLLYYAFICCLLVITFIDIDLQIIPDLITLPGIPVFFIRRRGIDKHFLDRFPAGAYRRRRQSACRRVGIPAGHPKGRHGRWRHQTSGDDRRFDRMAGGFVHHFHRLCRRHPGRYCHDAETAPQYEVGDTLRPLSVNRRHCIYFFWTPHHSLVPERNAVMTVFI